MYAEHKRSGFTLIELVVIVTILSILGTMGFFYYSSFVKDSRDVVRATDINNISQVLEIYFIKNGIFPIPDNATEIVYEDTTVWYQGVFGDENFKAVRKLSTKPLDPSTGIEYSYSLLKNRKEFELSTIFEGEIISFIPGVTQTYAAQKSAYIFGNYNKRFSVVKNNGNTTILALPSITSSTLGNTEVETIMENNDIVVHGGYNIPANYNEIIDPQTGGEYNTISNMVLFSGSLDALDSLQQKKLFIGNLQNTYKDSSVAHGLSESAYESLLKIDINNAQQVERYVENLSRKDVGGIGFIQ